MFCVFLWCVFFYFFVFVLFVVFGCYVFLFGGLWFCCVFFFAVGVTGIGGGEWGRVGVRGKGNRCGGESEGGALGDKLELVKR